jgi:hypothetical protein
MYVFHEWKLYITIKKYKEEDFIPSARPVRTVIRTLGFFFWPKGIFLSIAVEASCWKDLTRLKMRMLGKFLPR